MREIEESQVKNELPAELKDWLPGKVGYRNDVGHYPGVALKLFTAEGDKDAAEIANEYFALNPGLLLVDVQCSNDYLLCLFTKIISAEEKEEWDSVSREARRLLDERKAERAKRQEEAEASASEARKRAVEEKEAADKELKRLAELGRRHEKNCAKKGKE